MYVENYLLQRTFENRGYDQNFLNTFDCPDAGRLGNLDKMVEELRSVYGNGGLIVQIPDFDMDGIMSGVCGFSGLAELGFRVGLYFLNPANGYGFDTRDIDKIREMYPDVSAILTSDVGVSCFEGVSAAKKAGLRVLITDHHEPGRRLPEADCIVDPMLPNDTYEHTGICGAYVLYQVLQAYADRYGTRAQREQIRRLRVFAGIGTISDGMPLRYENRQLVRDAGAITELVFCNGSEFVIKNMPGSHVYQGAFRGLYEVCLMLRSVGKLKGRIDEELFGYYLAPMFNSVKRMNGDMSRAFGVFFGQDPRADANYLYDLNDKRKQAVAEYFSRLFDDDQPYKPYVWLSEAQEGILGLLAQRLCDQTGSPVLVIRKTEEGRYKGSGRSPSWYPFLQCTKDLRQGVSRIDMFAAGHQQAFGAGFGAEKDIAALCDFLKKDVQDALQNMPESVDTKPDFVIDSNGTGDTTIDILSFIEYLIELERFKPFGSGFAAPNIMLRFRPEEAEWKVMGSVKQHLKLTLQRGLEVLLWNQANKINYRTRTGQTLVVMGQLGRSTFRDIETVNFTGTMLDL